ncbi:MAG: coproporphyrinogen III oxidase [Proteobacteria bacterium]|nr:coproporphyrinogen III oxidase [Pseudomonadota bacterium]
MPDNSQPPNLPLAVYIHWPFCLSKCPYCDFNSHVRDQVDQKRWQAALLAELESMAAHMPGRTLRSVFFGGGTPSLMPPETVAALLARIGQLWPREDPPEITLEANPTSVEAGRFAAFRQAGVNRVSLGVQSLQDDELKFLGRGHSSAEARKAIALAAQHFPRFSFDLIYARPNQTPAAWQAELNEALDMAHGHMSLYQLTIEENTAFHHAYAKGQFALPDEETSEALYRCTEELMAAQSLRAYEVSNYAAPGQESRHNLAYWQGVDYIGIGPGAHGRLTQLNGQRQRIATQTRKSPERWLEAVEREGHGMEIWHEIPHAEEAQERLMMGLRLSEGIDYATFEKQTGFDLRHHINAKALALYTQHGLLEDSATHLRTTLKGRLVLNRLTAELLA